MIVTCRAESMKLSPQSEPDHFTGEAGFLVLHRTESLPADAPDPTPGERGTGTWDTYPSNVSLVRFEPGGRTHWHSHSGGQLLYVVGGEGWVQARGEAAQIIGPGDAVSIQAGEVHWHGARPASPMAHLAVTVGKPTWFEDPVPPPD